jgi:DNA transformation protein
MAVSDDFRQYVLEQLAGLGHVAPRPMFGCVGLYLGERIFGLIARDTLYFKVDDSNRRDYEARGMDRFRPYADKPLQSMNYYAVPADVLEDAEECVGWARKCPSVAAGSTKTVGRGRTTAAPPSQRRRNPRPR